MPIVNAVAAPPAEGYLDDVAYPDFFHREMTPLWLSSAATALGRAAPDPAAPHVWMELGCGAGLGALLTAAANPQAQCIGIDLNAAHVAAAAARAQAAGIDNIAFHRKDLSDLATADPATLPACDYIVLHGVYAWVSDAVQRAVIEIVRRWLKPGGLLYLGYMTHPGASAFAAAQRFMRVHAAAGTGSSDARARAALAALRAAQAAGAGYFSAQPDLARQLALVEAEGPGYLAHEFLNPHWQPLHVADVMAQCAVAGCSYIGSASLLENIDAVSLPEPAQALLRTIDDPVQAETLRDLARNQSQRRDLYQRTDGMASRHALEGAAHRAGLWRQVIAPLPGMPCRGPFVMETRIGPVEASDAVFSPLLMALQQGPQSFGALARLPAYAPQPGVLNQAFQALCATGSAHLALPVPRVEAGPAWRLNRLLSHGAQTAQRRWLAAPALGSAMAVTPVEGAAASALLNDPALRGDALRQATQARLAAAADATKPGPAAVDAQALDAFERATLPLWQHYGVVPR